MMRPPDAPPRACNVDMFADRVMRRLLADENTAAFANGVADDLTMLLQRLSNTSAEGVLCPVMSGVIAMGGLQWGGDADALLGVLRRNIDRLTCEQHMLLIQLNIWKYNLDHAGDARVGAMCGPVALPPPARSVAERLLPRSQAGQPHAERARAPLSDWRRGVTYEMLTSCISPSCGAAAVSGSPSSSADPRSMRLPMPSISAMAESITAYMLSRARVGTSYSRTHL